tara:strand:+ start:932 stop:1930 length:999 start_codon:yes stop_codon:yes gene_type:complete
MKKKKILVTGADGFIGSHLTEKLASQNKYNIIALVNYNSFGGSGWLDTVSSEVKNKINIISGDIRDIKFVAKITKDCDIICHLAALISIPFSYHSPFSYVDTNIKGTLNLLQSSVDNKVKKFIHTSTSEVYGSAQYIPIDEKHPINAQSPYAASKVAADQLVNSYRDTFGLNTITLRPFNTFGPRQSDRAVIPAIINQVLSNKKQIKLGNLYTKRDFNFIDDITDAFVLAIECKKKIRDVLNIGSNYSISIKKLISEISKLTGKKINIVVEKKRLRPKNGEVDHLLASNKQIKKYLNWRPKYYGDKGFSKALELTINWFRKNKHFYKKNFYY